jgi:hypothetical protein
MRISKVHAGLIASGDLPAEKLKGSGSNKGVARLWRQIKRDDARARNKEE